MTAEGIFQRQHLPVFRYLSRMTGSPDRAEELTQEVFVRVVRALPRYEPAQREQAWVFRIARNILLNHRRDLARQPSPESLDEADRPGATVHPIRKLELNEALSRVPAAEREVFLLRELGGLGYHEIAAICETTPDAVRSRIHRARLALRKALGVAAARRGAGRGRPS